MSLNPQPASPEVEMQTRVRSGGFLGQGISIALSEILFVGMLALDHP